MESENDNMPSSPNPTVDYLDDLDYFKDFENTFLAIVYNDGLTSKSNLKINPLVSSEHIDKFNLIDEASFFEYDEEIVSRFNDLFNIIHPDDSKSKKDNDDNDIDIIQSLEDNEITHGKNGLSKTSHDKTIRTFETGSFVMNLKVNIVIWEYYVNGMLFFLIINLYVPFGIPFNPKRYYKDGSYTNVTEAKNKSPIRAISSVAADQRHPWLRYQIQEYTIKGIRHRDHRIYCDGESRNDRRFLGPAPSYVLIRDPVRRLCYRTIAYSISGRGQAPEKVTDIDLFYLRSMDHPCLNKWELE
ncbi:hypothetical protein Tco_0477205 [Tanacetum coccineum]